MMTIYMYTTLLQVIFVTCVQINSTDKKQLWSSSFQDLKTLIERKHSSNTSSEEKVLFPLRPRFGDKCNKLKRENNGKKVQMSPLKCRGVLLGRCVSQMPPRPPSMPVDRISHKRRNLHRSVLPLICPFIRPSFHLVFSTSRRSAGTLCPLKSTKKHGLIKHNDHFKHLNSLFK